MQGFPSSTRPTRLCASGVLGAHARYRPTNALLSVCAGEPPSLILAGFTRRLAPCSAVDSASSDSGGFRHRKRCGCPWMQCTSHGRLVARSVRWVVQKERPGSSRLPTRPRNLSFVVFAPAPPGLILLPSCPAPKPPILGGRPIPCPVRASPPIVYQPPPSCHPSAFPPVHPLLLQPLHTFMRIANFSGGAQPGQQSGKLKQHKRKHYHQKEKDPLLHDWCPP